MTPGEHQLARLLLKRELLTRAQLRPILAARLAGDERDLLALIADAKLFGQAQCEVIARIAALLEGQPPVAAVCRGQHPSAAQDTTDSGSGRHAGDAQDAGPSDLTGVRGPLAAAPSNGRNGHPRTGDPPRGHRRNGNGLAPRARPTPGTSAGAAAQVDAGDACAQEERPILRWHVQAPPAPGRTLPEILVGGMVFLGGCVMAIHVLAGTVGGIPPYEVSALPRAAAPVVPEGAQVQPPAGRADKPVSEQTAYDRTKVLFDQAVSLAPESAQPYLERGQFMARHGRWTEAVSDYTRALERDPEYGPALLARALAWEVLEEIPRSVKDLNRARKLLAVRTTAESFMARLLNQSGNHADALRMVAETIARDPLAVGAIVERGKARFHLGQFDQAALDFGAVLKRRPQHQVALVYLGRLALGRGASRQAETYFSRARRSVPRSPQLAMIVADFYAGWGKLGEARRWYSRAAELGGPRASLANRLGLLAMREGRFERACGHFTKAIELDRQRAAYYNNRGNTFYVLSRWRMAIRDFKQSLELDPEQPEVHYALANAHGHGGQLTAAFHQFNTAIELNREDFRAHCYRATVLYHAGNYRKALEGFQDALQIRPDFRIARFYQALCEMAMDNNERAIHLLGELVAEAPNRPKFHHYLANAYMGMKSYEKAIQSYSRALRRNPSGVESLVNRAAAYRIRGLKDLAYADLIRVRQLTPERAGLDATISALEQALRQRR